MTRLGLAGAKGETMTQITIHEGGTGEKTLNVADIRIPDLWHPAMALSDAGNQPGSRAVLECWYLTHALLSHIKDTEPKPITDRELQGGTL